MATLILTPLEEYLTHSYSPDCEYVDGHIVERNVGELFHSLLQARLAQYLANESDRTGVEFETLVEQRMRVREGFDNERRYRIPDVMVLGPGYRRTGVTLDPPVLTVEILSPDDTLKELVAKSQEYIAFGVAVPVIADPYARRVYLVTAAGEQEIENRIVMFSVGETDLTIDFNNLFARLDRKSPRT
jgi:Uma2 family endonuclease